MRFLICYANRFITFDFAVIRFDLDGTLFDIVTLLCNCCCDIQHIRWLNEWIYLVLLEKKNGRRRTIRMSAVNWWNIFFVRLCVKIVAKNFNWNFIPMIMCTDMTCQPTVRLQTFKLWTDLRMENKNLFCNYSYYCYCSMRFVIDMKKQKKMTS